MLKKNIVIGLITAIIIILILAVIFTVKYGVSWWTDTDNDLLMFFPVWFILLVYVGYGTSKYYHNQKQLFFYKHKTKSDIEINGKWENHKKFMLSKLFMIIARLFAVVTPFYILAYIDKSIYLHSNPAYIISFAAISIICYFTSKKLMANYRNYNKHAT
jgi:hypothetical protein